MLYTQLGKQNRTIPLDYKSEKKYFYEDILILNEIIVRYRSALSFIFYLKNEISDTHKIVLRNIILKIKTQCLNSVCLHHWKWSRKVNSTIKSTALFVSKKVSDNYNTLIKKILKKIYCQISILLSSYKARRKPHLIRGKYSLHDFSDTLPHEYDKEFCARDDKLCIDEIENYRMITEAMSKLLSYYDIVIGYSTEGIYPLLLGRPYFAFEHGTIRDIPYEKTTQGRLCALTYRKAAHVFVTNFDCLPSAEFLCPGRFSLINHPFDEEQSLTIKNDWQREREAMLNSLDADLLLFHPTRHDWVVGKGYADKANDVFLMAFIKLRKAGYRVGLICCEWGANVENSKQLLIDNGVDEYVNWVSPLGVMAYTHTCKSAHLVIDQFKLGGFGGVIFKALAAGAPVMSYIDTEKINLRYIESPPIINCKTEDEIFQQLVYCFSNLQWLSNFGLLGQKWMRKYHGKKETANIQIKQFGLALSLT